MTVRWLVAALLVCVVFAGCGGKDTGENKVRLGDGTKIGLDVEKDQEPEDDFHGAISGVVVDDAIYPLPFAEVLIKARNLKLTADENGRFVFEDVVAGLHVVQVSKEGYATAAATVNLRGGDVAKAIIIAARVPIPEPYCRTMKFDAAAGIYNGIVMDGNTRFVAPVDDQPVASYIVESYWEGEAGEVSEESVLDITITPQSNATRAIQTQSGNPAYLAYDRTFLPLHEFAVAVEVRPSLNTVYAEMQGEIYVTAFYIDPAPTGWAFLAGDSTCG